jgi:hypothetical protein
LDGLKNIEHQAENKFISIRNVDKHRSKKYDEKGCQWLPMVAKNIYETSL